MNLKTSLFLLAGITAVSSFSFDAEAKRPKKDPTPTEPAPTDPEPTEPTEPTEPGCVGANIFEHDFVGWAGASWGQSGLELDSCEAVVVADLLESSATNLGTGDGTSAAVSFGAVDGWTLGADNKTVTLVGAACDLLRDGGVHDLAVAVECEKVQID